MKAVIAAIAPDALTIDISHAVPPQSVLAGQRLLKASVPYFPQGAVFLAVIDPGVGSARRPMALRSNGYTFVGPDNGLFTPWLPGDTAIELSVPDSASKTFHGRDVFAPAAAHLALGKPLTEMGPLLTEPFLLAPSEPRRRLDGTIEGEIAYVDHFGNLITNIVGVCTGAVSCAGHDLPLRATYASADPGQLLALVGSEGEIEIAVRDGSAAAALQLQPGTLVVWRP